MCDKEFKELVKIAVEKLKDESVLKLLKTDASYQKDSMDEGKAEDAFNQLDLTEKQREVCQYLIDCREKQDFQTELSSCFSLPYHQLPLNWLSNLSSHSNRDWYNKRCCSKIAFPPNGISG